MEKNRDLHCVVNGAVSFDASSLTDAKRTASKIANNWFNPYDDFALYQRGSTTPIYFRRINKKSPDNTIKYGKWN